MEIKKIYKKYIPYKIRILIRNTLFFFRFPIKHIDVCLNYIFHECDQFENTISIVAMVKNEGAYIKEWLEYHRLIGVDKFIIYDNNSTDNLKEILRPYIDAGVVDYIFYPKTQAEFDKRKKKVEYWAFQAYAYNDAIKKYRNKSKWIGIIDIDEFIVPVKKDNLLDVLNEIKNDIPKGKAFVGLSVNWVTFGFSGHKEKPEGLVIENFTRNDGICKEFKSMVNPRTVIQYQVHAALHFFHIEGLNEQAKEAYVPDISNSSITKIRINHYYTKSYDEYAQKIIMNRAGWPKANKYELPIFDPNYLSHNEDTIIARFIPLLKQKLNEK